MFLDWSNKDYINAANEVMTDYYNLIYKKGFGYRCERCGKTLYKINQDKEEYKRMRD